MTRALALLAAVVACSSKREPAPSPAPQEPRAPIDAPPIDAPPIAPGSVLRERALDQSPSTIVVTANAIYFSALSPGVFMLRDDQAKPIDARWATQLLADDDALYYVARDDRGGRLMRAPFAGKPAELAEWNGWIKALDATHLYLQAFENRAAVRVPKTGGEPLVLPCKYGLAVDEAWLYCIEGRELVRYDKTGQQRTVLGRVASARLTEGPVVTPRFVYASVEGDPDGVKGWGLVRVAKTGGEIATVARDVGNIYVLVAAGGEVYWVESKQPSTRKMIVRRMADDAAEPSDFADGFGYARSIFVTASTVFVSDSQPDRIVELKR